MSALATGAAAVLLRLRWPPGADVLGLQFGYFASYVVLFAAGCLGAKGRWLENVPTKQLLTWRWVSLAAAVAYAVVILADRWSPVFYAFWEPLFAWGVILSLLVFFQRHFVALSPAWQKLARRAYLIYIIHPPILVGVSLAMRALAAPALVKFALAGTAACFLCFLAAGALLAIPAVRRIV